VKRNKSNQNHQEQESAHCNRNRPILLARVGGAHLPSSKKGDGSQSDFDEQNPNIIKNLDRVIAVNLTV
jgi:hypothetical protein